MTTKKQEYKHELESGSVVEYADGKTLVTRPDGSQTAVDGDHYDNAVAVATLFGL